MIEKIKLAVIYIEGDGIQVKIPKQEDKRTYLAHFVIHEGSQSSYLYRRVVQNKYEIIEANN